MGKSRTCYGAEEAVRKLVDNNLLTLVSRLLIVGMFIYAALYKIVEPGSFAKSIWYYHLAPGSLINLMAVLLPWLEIFAGVALIMGIFYRGAVLWVNLMMVVFIIALTTTISRGIIYAVVSKRRLREHSAECADVRSCGTIFCVHSG